MALQFPQDPVANPEYEYNGVLYVWETDHWIVNSIGVGVNYVEYDSNGDVNLTGNLTVDSGSISSTSATFTGDLTAANSTLSGNLSVAGDIDNN